MVIGIGRDEQNQPVLFLGLEEGNIERLKQGKPIYRDLAEFGAPHLGKVVVLWGETTADIERQLAPGMHAETRKLREGGPS